MLARGPGDRFSFDATTMRALYSAHNVGKIKRDIEERDKLKKSRIGFGVIAWAGFTTSRTGCFRVNPRLNMSNKALVGAIGIEYGFNFGIFKTGVTLDFARLG